MPEVSCERPERLRLRTRETWLRVSSARQLRNDTHSSISKTGDRTAEISDGPREFLKDSSSAARPEFASMTEEPGGQDVRLLALAGAA